MITIITSEVITSVINSVTTRLGYVTILNSLITYGFCTKQKKKMFTSPVMASNIRGKRQYGSRNAAVTYNLESLNTNNNGLLFEKHKLQTTENCLLYLPMHN